MGDVQENFVGTERRNVALMLWQVLSNAIALVRLCGNDEQDEIGFKAGSHRRCSFYFCWQYSYFCVYTYVSKILIKQHKAIIFGLLVVS